MMIVNDNSRVINKLEGSLTDDARVIIYDRHMFIVQATGRWLQVALCHSSNGIWYLTFGIRNMTFCNWHFVFDG
jgi:hypothetical protein